MKYYAIYKNDKFIAITDNKKYMKHFIENRKGNYKVIKINDKELPDNIKQHSHFDDFMLTPYIGYHGFGDVILTWREYMEVEELMSDDAIILKQLLSRFNIYLKYFKFDKDSKRLIKYSLIWLIDFIENIVNTDEVLYDECFNIKKYFYEKYLDHKDLSSS